MSQDHQPKKVLIIGITGHLAQLTAKRLISQYPDAKITGVDMRPAHFQDSSLKKIEFKKIRYSRSHFEKLFRDNTFDTVFHLGRLSHSKVNFLSLEEKLDIGVVGTKRILDLSLKSGVKKIVLLSTFHVYGALSDNPTFIDEDMPLRAALKYSDLRDVVEMDHAATNWMWKHQNDISCTVLRPCNIIGPKINNTISQYLSYKYAPYPIDYNPMFQFIHEEDMAKVIVLAGEKLPTGLFNVSYDDVISLRNALRVSGNNGIPTLFGGLRIFAKVLKSAVWKIPDYLMDYLMYSCLIDNTLLKKYIPKDFFKYNCETTLKSLK